MRPMDLRSPLGSMNGERVAIGLTFLTYFSELNNLNSEGNASF